MTRGQEENVRVVWTRCRLARGRSKCFVAGVLSVDKGNRAVEEEGSSGGGREQWRRKGAVEEEGSSGGGK